MKIDMKGVLPLMGKKVKIYQVMKRRVNHKEGPYHGGLVTWEPHDLVGWGGTPRPRVGWFCGVRWLQEGAVHHASGGGYDYDPGYMDPSNTVPVAMVCFYPTQKPKPVPLLGCFPVDRGERPEAPVQEGWDNHKKYLAAKKKREAANATGCLT